MTLLEKVSRFLKSVLGYDVEDRLKSFSPLVNVNTRRDGGLNLKQRGDVNIVIFATSPEDLRKMLIGGRTDELVSKSKDGEELRGFTREDLQAYDAIALAAHYGNSKLLKLLEPIIDAEDLAALSMAMTIKRVEAAGNLDAARKLRDHLKREHKERGNRIFNFFSTGLLVEFMAPFLAMVAFTPTSTDIQNARRVWNLCLDHMENAIYVNRSMGIERVVGSIDYRLEVDKANVVLVFGMGREVSHTIRSAAAVLSLRDADRRLGKPRLKIEMEPYSIGPVEGIVARVVRTAPQ